MATATESKKMVTLRFPDGEAFEIEESMAKELQTIKHSIEKFQTIRHMIGDDCAEVVIPLPNVNSKVLSKVIEYSKKYKKMITLRSSDGEELVTEERVAKEFQAIKHMIGDESVIPLPKVNSKVLSKVIEYSKKHVESISTKSDEKTFDELKAWDAEFIKVDEDMLYDLMMASYRLDIKGLKRLACHRWWST